MSVKVTYFPSNMSPNSTNKLWNNKELDRILSKKIFNEDFRVTDIKKLVMMIVEAMDTITCKKKNTVSLKDFKTEINRKKLKE